MSYQIAREVLDSTVRARICRNELWTVSPAGNGWPARFTTLVELQPVGNDALRTQALARFRKMGAYVDAQIALARIASHAIMSLQLTSVGDAASYRVFAASRRV